MLPGVLGDASTGGRLPGGVPVRLGPLAQTGTVAQNLPGLLPWQDVSLVYSLVFGGSGRFLTCMDGCMRQPSLLLRQN